VHGESLIVRTDPGEQEQLLVDPAGCAEDEDLRRWVERGIAYAKILPPK